MQLNSNTTNLKESILQTLLSNNCISQFTDITVEQRKTKTNKNTMVTISREGNTKKGTNNWIFRAQFRESENINNKDGKTHRAFDELHKDMLIDAEEVNGEKKHQITIEGIGFLKALKKLKSKKRT